MASRWNPLTQQPGARLIRRSLVPLACLAVTACVQNAGEAAPAVAPERISSAMTTAAITDADLRERVRIFADDSMLGRNAPGPGDMKAADYLAAELARLGLEPAGDAGTFVQDVRFGVRGDSGVGRNVVAILRGSDPARRNEFVAIGAHKDHEGIARRAVDHDSLRIVTRLRRLAMFAGEGFDAARIRQAVDSVRRLRPPRLDSIFNGADDDASGSMAMLEIAEALAAAPRRPRRSILFVWHTGEEDGLLGSRWFVDHPTVPLGSIVAQVNVDMIGRGTAADIPEGGDDYLIAVGHRRTSSELGRVVDSVNAAQPRPFRIDLSWDDPQHPEQIYSRSDHASYASRGIPIVFFFTGLHDDYHAVTDEPQYLDYPHYTRIVRYIGDVVTALADRDRRPAMDRPR